MSSRQSRNRQAARQGVHQKTFVQFVADKAKDAHASTRSIEDANTEGAAKVLLKSKNRLIPCIGCGKTFDSKFKYWTCWTCMDAKRTKRIDGDAERIEMAKLMNDLTARKKAMGAKW